MLKRFLPKEVGFFTFFEQHAALTLEASREMVKLTGSTSPEQHAVRIKELEHKSDEVTHQCIEALHSTFITPMDRPDIQRLIHRLDDIVDAIDASASRINLYELKEMRPEAKALAEVLERAVTELGNAVHLLRNLKDPASIKKACVRVHDIESEGDDILRQAIARLFREEAHDPMLVIKWNGIFETMERAIDRCEDVADVIEGVLIEAS